MDTATIISGTFSDSIGYFSFQNVQRGIYILKFQMCGFGEHRQIIEKKETKDLNLNTITLAIDDVLLGQVTVRVIRETITKTNIGFVINADANLSYQGGTAIAL